MGKFGAVLGLMGLRPMPGIAAIAAWRPQKTAREGQFVGRRDIGASSLRHARIPPICVLSPRSGSVGLEPQLDHWRPQDLDALQ